METLSPSIFCDATFNVTVYNYQVVMISTFDGNNMHRPLMCSFILNSTGPQWRTIFNIFKLRSVTWNVIGVRSEDGEEGEGGEEGIRLLRQMTYPVCIGVGYLVNLLKCTSSPLIKNEPYKRDYVYLKCLIIHFISFVDCMPSGMFVIIYAHTAKNSGNKRQLPGGDECKELKVQKRSNLVIRKC